MDKPADNLTPADRQLLAREVALDKFSGRYNHGRREDWRAGWDAALEWVKGQVSEGVAHLDGDGKSSE